MATYSAGVAVDYLSSTLGDWTPTSVTAVSSSGDIQVRCKPGAWISSEHVGSKIRRREVSVVPDAPPAPDLRVCGSETELPQRAFQVRDVAFRIKTAAGEKQILHGINLTVQGGETLAILGPSGAGKTTLLELMALQHTGGEVAGSATLNGKPLTPEMFRDEAFYVEQYDAHWGFLTCREILEYSAQLRIQGGKAERQEKVALVMGKLGITGCADTMVGNEFFKGISGGQKKRLSLAVALLKGTSLLFVDEPTSGLDAAAAASVIGFIQQLAKEDNMIIITTIHQPSTPVFMSFSSVMFLADGSVAYHGSPQHVEQYCADIGWPLPAYTNPADHVIRLINSDFVGTAQVNEVVARWGSARSSQPQLRDIEFPKPSERTRQGVCSQTLTMLRRQGLICLRDPSLYLGRMVVFLFTNAFFATVYWKARTRNQEFVLARFFLMGWLGSTPTLFSVVAVYAHNQQFKLVAKEVKNGLVSARSYMLATTLLEGPYMVILAMCAMLIPLYGLAAGNGSGLVGTICIMTVSLWCFECMAQCAGVFVPHAPAGMLAMLGFWINAFLFSGGFLKPDFIIMPFRELVNITPLFYAMRSFIYLEFNDTVWDGAQLTSEGFMCTQPGLCYGRNGEQVMTTLSQSFSSAAGDHVATDTAVLLLMAFTFKCICLATIVFRSRRVGWTTRARKAGHSSTSLVENRTPPPSCSITPPASP